MEINLSFDLKEDEKKLLADIFSLFDDNGDIDQEKLSQKLSELSKASLEEYLRMILGQKVFTRGRDIREYRMYLFIKEVFDNKIPESELVSSIFQTTSSESRSLIKSVLSKYQYELKSSLESTLKKIISDVQIENDKFIAVIFNENLKNELNKILSVRKKSALKQIIKEKGTIANYIIPADSYLELCQHFNLNPKNKNE
jgi:hypothetical protein